MDKIHPDAIAMFIEGNKQVGWHFENRDFVYQAIQSRYGHVNVYVIWGEDRSVDMTWFIDWEGVQRYLDILLGQYIS